MADREIPRMLQHILSAEEIALGKIRAIRSAACPAVKSYRNPKINVQVVDGESGQRGIFANGHIDEGELLMLENFMCVCTEETAGVIKFLSPARFLTDGVSCPVLEDAGILLAASKLVAAESSMDARRIARRNWFASGDKENLMLVARYCSMFNHSCSPNVIFYDALDFTVAAAFAHKPIQAGDECTMSYIYEHLDESLAAREAALNTYASIERCSCPKCAMERAA